MNEFENNKSLRAATIRDAEAKVVHLKPQFNNEIPEPKKRGRQAKL